MLCCRTMRSYVVAIAAVALTGFFGYRQWKLEQRIDEITRELGAAAADDSESAPASARASDGSEAVKEAARTHAARLAALETTLASVRADIRSLEKATGDMPQGQPVSDQQILTVMKEQGQKVVENQLKFHRERWLEQRELGLGQFTQRFGLNQQQSDQLWGLMSSEVDKFVEILRKPESYENPELMAKQWKEILYETDSAAHKFLDPQMSVAWDQTRYLERKTFWPWLPE